MYVEFFLFMIKNFLKFILFFLYFLKPQKIRTPNTSHSANSSRRRKNIYLHKYVNTFFPKENYYFF